MASPGGLLPHPACFSDFPEDVQLSILSFLRPPALAAFACTSRHSALLCSDPRLWSAMCNQRWGSNLQIPSPAAAAATAVPFELLYRALDQWDALVGFWWRIRQVAACAGPPPLVSFEWDPSSVTGDDTAESSSAAAEPLGLERPAEAQSSTTPLDGRAGVYFTFVRELLISGVSIPFAVACSHLGVLTRSYSFSGYPEDPWAPFVRRVWGFLVQRRRLGALRVRNLEEAKVRDAGRWLEIAARILDVQAGVLALRDELEEAREELDAVSEPTAGQKRGRGWRAAHVRSARAKIARVRRGLEGSLGRLPTMDEVMALNSL